MVALIALIVFLIGGATLAAILVLPHTLRALDEGRFIYAAPFLILILIVVAGWWMLLEKTVMQWTKRR